MDSAIHGGKCAAAIDDRKDILLDMPFRMTARTRDNIAREGIMPESAKRNGDDLRFFAGNERIEGIDVRL